MFKPVHVQLHKGLFRYVDMLRLLFINTPWAVQTFRKAQDIVAAHTDTLDVLDIGGRRSPYTLGLEARVTITELPRATELQEKLNLGLTEKLVQELQLKRRNVKAVIFDDMTSSTLPDASFDVAIAVEVLEHVENDRQFVENVYRVLKPEGYFILTTPNGENVPNTNPDHKRHYTQKQLSELLLQSFENATVEFSTLQGLILYIALRSPRRFWYAAPAIYLSRLISHIRSSRAKLGNQPDKTVKLFAVAQKLSE